MKAIWKEAKTAIKLRIPNHCFRMWIEPLKLTKCDESSFYLASPNFFSRKRVLDHYGDLITAEISKAAGKPYRCLIEVSASDTALKNKFSEDFQLPLPNMNPRPYNGRLLRKDFTFDHFVVGGSNDFAYSASLSMASKNNSLPNALFLLSKTGMGKSHLSQAIGHYILSEH
ncbi:MAG: DnaA/Hda family protein, partial [Ignavibacteriaceae bacterium]